MKKVVGVLVSGVNTWGKVLCVFSLKVSLYPLKLYVFKINKVFTQTKEVSSVCLHSLF